MNELKKALIILLLFYFIVLSVNVSSNYAYYATGGDWMFSVSFSLVTTTIGWAGYMLFYRFWLRKKLGRTKNPALILIISVLTSAIYGIVIMVVAMKFLVWVMQMKEQGLSDYVGNSIYAALFGIIMGLVLTGNDFLSMWKKSIQDNERLKRNMLLSQFEILKNQINPHFFFNNLNTLQVLIRENPDLAECFVGELAKVFRYSMKHIEEKLVTVETELKVAGSYLFLCQQRFENNLQVNIDITKEVRQLKIVPYALLTLIENVVKHNEISELRPLKLDIYNDRECHIIVANDLQPKTYPEVSQGIGLINIVERYKILTDAPVQVERNHLFIVKIPLLQ